MTSNFITPLWLEDVDGDTWIVAADFIYYSILLNGTVVVPIMTETDLASIPYIFRGLVPKSGKYNKAAVLHDAGYHGNLMTWSNPRRRINLIKPLCDKLFLEAMEISGVSKIERLFMYRMVSEFGAKKG